MQFATATMVFDSSDRPTVKRVTRAAVTTYAAVSLALSSLLRFLSLSEVDARSGACTLSISLAVTCFQSQVGEKLVYNQHLVDGAEDGAADNVAKQAAKDLGVPLQLVPEDTVEQAGGF